MIKDQDGKKEVVTEGRGTCGIIMPIADHPSYPLGHWKDVQSILFEAIKETEFKPQLVSDDPAIGLIHDRIVTNTYTNEIVVCDVSSKNPNVMFELGLRLAFDKPTIIIKDEKTDYSFDTGVIEHLNYPSSLRFSSIVKFKTDLVMRISATYKKHQDEPNYSPFLKSFGKTFTPSSIKRTEISESKYILDELGMLRREMSIIKRMFRDSNNITSLRNIVELENARVSSMDLDNERLQREPIRNLDELNFRKMFRDELNDKEEMLRYSKKDSKGRLTL